MAALRILLSGGGTGGHIYPALAIAAALKELVPDSEFLFVGAEGKMEMRRIPEAGYKIVGLPVAGFHRSLDKRNFAFPFKLVRSLGKARKTVKDFNPDVAIGTGGYASGPALAAAYSLGVPVFLQEQNALAGVTNRLLGKIAKSVFVAYPEAITYFASAKTIHTGNPLRKSLSADSLTSKEKGRVHFGLDPNKPTLLSFGGSLGARKMNDAFVEMHAFWKAHQELQVIWQTGEGYFARFSESETAKLPNVKCVPYLERMDLAYAAADLVACRAGALSISELQLLGKPSLLIPSPNVSGDHQTANAKAVERTGAAVLIPDNQQVEKLSATLSQLLGDSQALAQMAKAASDTAKPAAAQHIAQHILEYVSR
jgi:UDP-N-acetylglucosamine--N-acetylmuramyl-(pentapeptide) pyrophosphoryl-undecaprenol N-acetylglucosamine transferase